MTDAFTASMPMIPPETQGPDMTGLKYMICKYGGFYRPNCQGYTDRKSEAGLYSRGKAIRETHPNGPDGPRDGMTYVLADDVSEDGRTIKEGAQK